jgi:hypothetical protein
LGPLQILRCLSSLEELPLSLHRLHSFFRNPMHLSTSLWISQSTKYRRKQMSWKTKWSLDYVSIPMRLVSIKFFCFSIFSPVRFAKKTSWKVPFADLWWEKNTVPSLKKYGFKDKRTWIIIGIVCLFCSQNCYRTVS